MNTETPATTAELDAERWVNRGIWRVHEGRAEEAVRCLDQALVRVPDHLEALRQLALVLANHRSDPERAARVLQRLRVALPAGDPRLDEVDGALRALGSGGA
jgi:cytochrome c-type biogenesis protein CcmH/NrfG